MAVIYDLNVYRAPRLLNAVAQQTGGIVHMIHLQLEHLHKLEEGFNVMQGILRDTRSSLDKAEGCLEEANAVHEASLKALKTGRVEDMMRARDEIAKHRLSLLRRRRAACKT